MPRKSLRRRVLDLMQERVQELNFRQQMREVMDESDSFEDDLLIKETDHLKNLMKRRFLFRSSTYRKKRIKFNLDDALSYDSNIYNDEEFLNTFRITRDSFFLFLEEMKTKKAFIVKSKSSHQRPISYQLLVYLYRIGKEGSHGGSIEVAGYFGIGKGSIDNYVKRVISALDEIKDEIIYWPDESERKKMRKRLSPYGFRHCVGIIDGTLVILDYRPLKYHECYFSRKSFYALNVMIVCDDQKRVIYYNAGWPGSTHDNRVFRNSQLYLNRGDFFSHQEYLLGDSAYSASPIMVQSFKKQSAQSELQPHNEFFNTCLAQVRISTEHCIGMLKGRFRCMKRSNIKLKDGKKEVKNVVDLIGSCIVMHNLLINYDETDIPDSWYENEERRIDWSMYDEEEERIAQVTEENTDRRQYVFNSIVNNYLI